MRSDLQDWFIALKLAKSIDPTQEPLLSKKLAQQLELQGEHSDALRLFERAAATFSQSGLTHEKLNAEVL